jgi:hypothetical protein
LVSSYSEDFARIHDPLVIYWIRKLGLEVKSADSLVPIHKKIPLLEIDELYTYVQKKRIKSEYGLLLIETGCVLLDLKLEMQALKS